MLIMISHHKYTSFSHGLKANPFMCRKSIDLDSLSNNHILSDVLKRCKKKKWKKKKKKRKCSDRKHNSVCDLLD